MYKILKQNSNKKDKLCGGYFRFVNDCLRDD